MTARETEVLALVDQGRPALAQHDHLSLAGFSPGRPPLPSWPELMQADRADRKHPLRAVLIDVEDALLATGSSVRCPLLMVISSVEPCNHQGRTPPCRQSLIDAGIRRVVIAIIDPTSRGEGGVVELRRAGVDVETGASSGEPPDSIFLLRNVHGGIPSLPADQHDQSGW